MTVRYPDSETDIHGDAVEENNSDLSNPVAVRLPQASDPCQADVINAPARQLRDRMALAESRTVFHDGNGNVSVNGHLEASQYLSAPLVMGTAGVSSPYVLTDRIQPRTQPGDIAVETSVDISGNVSASGDARIGGDVSADGNLSAGGSLSVGGSARIETGLSARTVAARESLQAVSGSIQSITTENLSAPSRVRFISAKAPLRVMHLVGNKGTSVSFANWEHSTWTLTIGGVVAFSDLSVDDAAAELATYGDTMFIGGECRSSTPQNSKTYRFGSTASVNKAYLEGTKDAVPNDVTSVELVGFAV